MPKKTKDLENLDTKKLKTDTSDSKTKSKTSKTKAKVSSKPTKKTSTSKSTSRSSKKDSTLNSSKKNSNKKSTVSKSSNKTSSVKKKKVVVETPEYYDLPYRYNDTIVKILYQTPTKLFVYWDISDTQREQYLNQYGKDFFSATKPVLIIRNQTKNYSFEVEINDFANSWYLNIPDPKCNYTVELGRRSKDITNYSIPNNYIYVASSNNIESPNDHILFEKEQNMVYFRNVKSNKTFSKNIATFSFIRNMGKIYNIYDQYKEIYKENNEIFCDNPSSLFK